MLHKVPTDGHLKPVPGNRSSSLSSIRHWGEAPFPELLERRRRNTPLDSNLLGDEGHVDATGRGRTRDGRHAAVQPFSRGAVMLHCAGDVVPGRRG